MAGPSPSDVALVMFTSGSSGVPKGVIQTHRGLAYKMRLMVDVHRLGVDDVSLMPLPMAHVSGLLNGLLVPAAAGMTTVLMERWDPALGLDLIERERVSFMVGPPPLFTALMDRPDFSSERVSSLRVMSTGAMGVSTEFVSRSTRELGAQVKRSFGSTELPTIATTLADDPFERSRDTDGRVVGEGELRTVDPTTGDETKAGEAGEVVYRGPEMLHGYLDPAATEATIRDGWFHTGDLGVLDDDGWLRIVGRLKDTIIRGGENIAPAEVEHVLEAHPGGPPGRGRRLPGPGRRRACRCVRRRRRCARPRRGAVPGSPSARSPVSRFRNWSCNSTQSRRWPRASPIWRR